MKDDLGKYISVDTGRLIIGGIPEEEWQKIKAAFPEQIKILYQE